MHPASLDPVPSNTRRSLPDALNELFVMLEDLLKRIADTDDVHIRALRARVRAQLVAIQQDMSGRPVPAPTPVPSSSSHQATRSNS